jgi:hypothetical protein
VLAGRREVPLVCEKRGLLIAGGEPDIENTYHDERAVMVVAEMAGDPRSTKRSAFSRRRDSWAIGFQAIFSRVADVWGLYRSYRSAFQLVISSLNSA